ncbi:MAG: efflux RND transporter permease subunit [Firmicutes bacterium]|nr:efflux RND transporter permease subunit [Bacillota bacterium]
MKNFNLTEWALENKSVIYFFIILAFIVGAYSYQSLGRMEYPDYVIRQMVVSTAWPGASAQQVEEQVTDKIEKQLQNTPGLDYLQSYSTPGQSVIYVNLKVEVGKDQLQPTWFKVRNSVLDIKDTLPSGVVGPYFNDDYADVFGSIYALTSDGFTYEDMRAEAERIRRTLLGVNDVKKVELIGVQPEKIYIEMESSKLSKLGINPNSIIASLQAQNAMTPSGMIETSSDRVYLRVSGMFDDVDSIRNMPVNASSGTFRLGDIATVKRGYADPPEPKMYFNGQPAVGLAISMEEGGNILNLEKDLNENIAKINQDLPLGMELNRVADQPAVVKEAINEFVITLIIAIAIVLLVCFLSLGMRTGIVVALCIPLVIAGVLIGMKTTGIDLHKVSLGALIVALGLLVDDAIIVVESMKVKLEQGWDRGRSASFAFASTAGPRLTGALITSAGFIPMGLTKGSVGELLGSMFLVVAMALLISWVVAGTATPLMGYHLIKVKPATHERSFDLYDTKFYRLFKQILIWCLNHRKLVLALTLAAFLGSILLMTLLKNDFFPPPSRPEIIVDMKLPEGASIQAADAEANKFAQTLEGDPDIVNYSYYVGQGAPRFLITFFPSVPDSSIAQFMIVSRDVDARDRLCNKINETLSQQFPSVLGQVRMLQTAPMFNYPVMLRVTGEDEGKVREIAKQVESVMVSQPYLNDVNLDWSEKSKVIHLEVDQDKARMLGVNSQSLASTLQSQLSGAPISEYREKDRTVSMVFRLDAMNRANLTGIKDLNIPTGSGQFVPLDQVARISYGAEEGLLGRRDLKPSITVQAKAGSGITDIDATKRVYDSLKGIREGLPLGYTIEVGGIKEMADLAIANLVKQVPLMIIVIVILLMLQLRSMPKMILTLLTAPLGMIGVAPILLLTRQPLCFVVYCGILALAGIIIRNSIILIDQIEQQLKAGESTWDAIIHAAVQRFRPIVLTAAAAILGMIPLTTSVLWGPMAVAIAGGLFAATLLTLLVLPTMYAAWYKVKPGTEIEDVSISD